MISTRSTLELEGCRSPVKPLLFFRSIVSPAGRPACCNRAVVGDEDPRSKPAAAIDTEDGAVVAEILTWGNMECNDASAAGWGSSEIVFFRPLFVVPGTLGPVEDEVNLTISVSDGRRISVEPADKAGLGEAVIDGVEESRPPPFLSFFDEVLSFRRLEP